MIGGDMNGLLRVEDPEAYGGQNWALDREVELLLVL